MKKILALIVLLLPAVASADSVGGCGFGSKLFEGQRGIAPQVLAVTTNGTSGNQTFGISSGTLGCEQNGVVKSQWRVSAFIDNNMHRLALDISRGQGETLDSLASLVGVSSADRPAFASALQSNFDRIFSSASTTSQEAAASIRQVLAENASLTVYTANI